MINTQNIQQSANGIVNRAGYFHVLGSIVGAARVAGSVALGVIGTLAYILCDDTSLINIAGRGIARGLTEIIGGIPLLGDILATLVRDNLGLANPPKDL